MCVNVGTLAVYSVGTASTHVTPHFSIEDDLIVLSASVMRSHTQQEMPGQKLALLFNISKACDWAVAGLHKNHSLHHPAIQPAHHLVFIPTSKPKHSCLMTHLFNRMT